MDPRVEGAILGLGRVENKATFHLLGYSWHQPHFKVNSSPHPGCTKFSSLLLLLHLLLLTCFLLPPFCQSGSQKHRGAELCWWGAAKVASPFWKLVG